MDSLTHTPEPQSQRPYAAIEWVGNAHGTLRLLDQTLLPRETRSIDCRTVEEVWDAIKLLKVRGAPAIGVAAAYGVVLGCQASSEFSRAQFDQRLREVTTYLATSRPTAVNLFWALDRVRRVGNSASELNAAEALERIWSEARTIEAEDRAMCSAMASHGAPLLANCEGVLTHCNTGALATAGEGTALAVIIEAARHNPALKIFADETRPLLQGARLTAWELHQRQLKVSLICDSMAAWVMKQGLVQAVIVGADRIAANGDSANKIGTYGLSVLAKAHRIPFYIVAPSSTFDRTLPDGSCIPIEQRSADEISRPFGTVIAPEGCPVYNPAFDVAPAENITALVTEKGVITPVNATRIAALLD